MSVQHDVRTVTVPRPAEPADPPLATSPATTSSAMAGVPGCDRPRTRDERHFVLAMGGVFGGLSVIILTFLLLAQYVWS